MNYCLREHDIIKQNELYFLLYMALILQFNSKYLEWS